MLSTRVFFYLFLSLSLTTNGAVLSESLFSIQYSFCSRKSTYLAFGAREWRINMFFKLPHAKCHQNMVCLCANGQTNNDKDGEINTIYVLLFEYICMTSKIGVVNEWMNSFVCINMYDCTLKLSVYFVFQQFVTSLMPVITLEAINSGWLYLSTQANVFNKTQTCRWFYSHSDRFLVCNYLFAICQWIQLTPTRSKNQYRSFKSNKSFFSVAP